MKKLIFNYFVFMVSSIGSCAIGYSQIIDLNRNKPYTKVFVETDNFGASYLDTLEMAYPNMPTDAIGFSVLNDLAYYWHTRNLNKALDFTKRGLSLTAEKKDSLWEGRFQITQGAILLRMEKLDSAQIVLQAAERKVMEADLPLLYTQLGYVYERRGLLGKAADFAVKSMELGEKLNDKKAIALAYSDLSNLFWKQSKFEKGLEYGLKSLKLFEERGINDLDYDFTLYVVGNNYLALKQQLQALNYYQHAIAVGERYRFDNNLSDIYISLTDLYADLSQFRKGEEAGKKALKYAQLLDNNFMVMRSWLSLGKLQILEGKYPTAIESLTQCIKVATDKFGDAYYLSQAYNALGKAYAGNHDYQNAYQAFDRYDKLKSKVFTAESDQRISLLQTEFDMANKEGTIKQQMAQLKKQRSRQLMVTIIAILLLLLLLLAYKIVQNNRKKNRQLQKQNEEKEFLLKEIHHRVKNNLEIVSSLLALQSAQIKNSDLVGAMKESQHRVYSMSMIHQRLYQRKNLSSVEMKEYFEDLGQHILESFGMEDRITLCFDMKPIEVDVDTAIPLGLIVNELLTNSLKYAFPNQRTGKISIILRKSNSRTLYLEVADDGIGQPTPFKSAKTGFGLQLVDLLMQQLSGKMKYNLSVGTCIQFEFDLDHAA
ncbi:histidine kinase [Flavobacteriaceae bacterium F89]|uniref:histidine kinase n=1 Tax=Cerina litoralis TaxID=2874477 RepID=A0AAE3ETG5_9FLAO|nr:histidine kinase dimerization/phosphoacceptor domain -containing protein [Cerina litoralis]MCG2459276.1 histidine kinase [Cerina litoralis]